LRWFAVAAILILAFGCASVPTRSMIAKIEVNKSTRADVHGILGKPKSPGKYSDVWEWRKIDGKKPSVEINYQGPGRSPLDTDTVVEKQARNIPEGPSEKTK